MKYRVEYYYSSHSEDPLKLIKAWFEDVYAAMEYFIWKAEGKFQFKESPPVLSPKSIKLYKEDKLVCSVERRDWYYPYYLKVFSSVEKEDLQSITYLLYWNVYKNAIHRDSTICKRWHEEIIIETGELING